VTAGRNRIWAVYSRQFFATYKDGSLHSARQILPFVFSLVPHNSVVDIGCGIGTWLSVAKELGAKKVRGFDGEYVDSSMLTIDQSEFRVADLKSSISCDQPFDLAMCLEVGEHLPDSSAVGLVDSLASLAPVVLFSAAIPGQGGTGHINEQWPDYWCTLFKRCGFACVDILRVKFWTDPSIEPWYIQNAFIYARQPNASLVSFVTDHPPSLVHPQIFGGALANTSLQRRLKRFARSSVRRLQIGMRLK
jgi:SAM-dependent methyltransferase